VRRFAPQLFAQLFCIGLVLFSISSSYAQTTNRPTSQQQIQNRDWGRGNPREATNFSQYQQLLEQARLAMKTDFRNLQLINNQLMVRMFKPTPAGAQKITPSEIRSSLGEIKKLAERLRLNFGFAKPKPAPSDQIALAPGLLQLDDAIMSFVWNPFFQQPRVYDVELVTRAEKSLGEILTLVEELRKITKE